MAEVFIGLTHPGVPEAEWPPKPAQPLRSDAPKASDFVPAPAPVSNDDAVVIAHRTTAGEFREKPAAPIALGNVETYATPNGRPPVSNETGAGFILGHPPAHARLRHNNQMPAPLPINTGLEVVVVPGPKPIENDPNRSIAYAPPRQEVAPPLVEPPPPTVLNIGQGDVQILPSGQPIENPQTTFGGGGVMARHSRSEEIQYLGKHTLSIGAADIVMAPVGDTTRLAGGEDRTLVESAGMLGNQESQAGATGEPVANKDLQDVNTDLGRGKPKNVKG